MSNTIIVDNYWPGLEELDKNRKFLKIEILSGGQISCEKFNSSDDWTPPEANVF